MRRDISLMILYDDKHRILLQHRDDDAPSFPGMWSFFGGGIDEDEDPKRALRRESGEELNYTPRKPYLLHEKQYEHPHIEQEGTKYYFIEECLDKKSLKLGEGQGWGWFKWTETLGLNIAIHNRDILKMVEKYMLYHHKI